MSPMGHARWHQFKNIRWQRNIEIKASAMHNFDLVHKTNMSTCNNVVAVRRWTLFGLPAT